MFGKFKNYCNLARVNHCYPAGLALVTLLLLQAFPRTSGAQDSAPTSLLENPSTGGNLGRFFTAKTPYEFWLTCLICVLGVMIIGALILSLRRFHSARPEDIARPVIVVTVIIGTLILVTAGYNNEQIAPAFGLFGTIVGYMLGRLAQMQPSPDARTDEQPSAPPRTGVQETDRTGAHHEAGNASR